MQWYSKILPRINSFLPTRTILGLGCGFRRWTRWLKKHCERLVGVHLSERCTQACRERFLGDARLIFYSNDGRSLEMLPDHSVDFVFSFDSLVHADEETIHAYIAQLPRLLTKTGAAFIHHLNLGAYFWYRRFPRLSRGLSKLGLLDRWHYRDVTLTAAAAARYAEEAGLICARQEIVPWGARRMLIDCFSTSVTSGSSHNQAKIALRNPTLMQERAYLKRLAPLYSPPETTSEG